MLNDWCHVCLCMFDKDLGALDMDSMLLDVSRWRDKQSTHHHQSNLPLLVIEGFLIFNHRLAAIIFLL